MNINRINASHISSLYKQNQNDHIQIKSNKSTAKDDVVLSESGKIFQAALKAVNEQSEVSEAKVARLSAQVKNGEYSVKSSDIADKMLTNAIFIK